MIINSIITLAKHKISCFYPIFIACCISVQILNKPDFSKRGEFFDSPDLGCSDFVSILGIVVTPHKGIGIIGSP